MSQIVPSPNARQIRQALQQGLQGIAQNIIFGASAAVFAQPLAAKFASFLITNAIAIKAPATTKTPAFTATTPVVQVTHDTTKSASFAAVGTAKAVAESGSFDLTLEATIHAGEAGSFTKFETQAQVFQI